MGVNMENGTCIVLTKNRQQQKTINEAQLKTKLHCNV